MSLIIDAAPPTLVVSDQMVWWVAAWISFPIPITLV